MYLIRGRVLAHCRQQCCAAAGCSAWQQRTVLRVRYISTASALYSKRRQIPGKPRDPIVFSPKAKLLPLRIWHNATVAEIAEVAQCTHADVITTARLCRFADEYATADAGNKTPARARTHVIAVVPFGDLTKLVKALGYVAVPVPNPNASPTTAAVPDGDVQRRPPPTPAQCVRRSPVVTIMGHVDHGKTTLLDALRHSNIVDREFGGITQHIGAFRVQLPGTPHTITFLDTPGHAAFAQMRQRGANATDIVVLVVAADDGVMEQTIESIRYARNANVPFVVAINKCDRASADDIERTKQMLLDHGIVTEDLGGDTMAVAISARKKTNLSELREAIVTQAELLDLRGDPNGLVEGVVIESRTQPGIGKLCTVLVQRGTLRRGDVLVCEKTWARVRTLYDEHGKVVQSATLSVPVEVAGWKEGLPGAGDDVLQVATEEEAKRVVAYRLRCAMEEKAKLDAQVISEQRARVYDEYKTAREERLAIGWFMGFQRKATDELETTKVLHKYDPNLPQLRLLIKADVAGSLEALLDVLQTYDAQDACALDVVDVGVGVLTDDDLVMAEKFSAVVYLFNVPLPKTISEQCNKLKIVVKEHNVIYHLVDSIKAELEARLPDKHDEHELGSGRVLQEFRVSLSGRKLPVAGTKVERGTLILSPTALFRITRAGAIVYEGGVQSMKRGKEAVTGAGVGDEVGLLMPSTIDDDVAFQTGDHVQCFERVLVKQRTTWQPPGFSDRP